MSLEIQDVAVVEEVVGIPAGDGPPFADSVPVKKPAVMEILVARAEGGYLVRVHYHSDKYREVVCTTDAKLIKLLKTLIKE